MLFLPIAFNFPHFQPIAVVKIRIFPEFYDLYCLNNRESQRIINFSFTGKVFMILYLICFRKRFSTSWFQLQFPNKLLIFASKNLDDVTSDAFAKVHLISKVLQWDSLYFSTSPSTEKLFGDFCMDQFTWEEER